jgi:hypothetical protein
MKQMYKQQNRLSAVCSFYTFVEKKVKYFCALKSWVQVFILFPSS